MMHQIQEWQIYFPPSEFLSQFNVHLVGEEMATATFRNSIQEGMARNVQNTAYHL